MEIHRFEAIWIGVSLVLIVAWIATVTYGAVGPPGIEMVDGEGGTVDAGLVAEGDYDRTDGFRSPGVYQRGPDRYDAYVVARQFLFEPGTSQPIRVPARSTVTLYLTSPDVIHGFELAGTNVNVMVIPGQVSKVTVEFGPPATYGIVCNEYCGSGHHTMEGQLRVVPRSAFNTTEA